MKKEGSQKSGPMPRMISTTSHLKSSKPVLPLPAPVGWMKSSRRLAATPPWVCGFALHSRFPVGAPSARMRSLKRVADHDAYRSPADHAIHALVPRTVALGVRSASRRRPHQRVRDEGRRLSHHTQLSQYFFSAAV